MVKDRSSATWLLIAIRSLTCPLLALCFASPSGPGSVPPSMLCHEASNPAPLINLYPILLTKKQLANLDQNLLGFLSDAGSHDLILDYSDPGSAATAEGALWAIEWLRNGLRDKIQNVTVEGWGSLTNFTSLAAGLQRITLLDELHWLNNDPIPKSVLSALESFHPNCKILYNMVFSNWDTNDSDVPPIQAPGKEPHQDIRSQTRNLILKSANLYSLKTEIEYGGSPNPENLRLVHRILTTCTNLREIDISIRHRGCVFSDGQPYGFDFSGSSKLALAAFPPFESIRLSGYRLDGPYHGTSWPPMVIRRDPSDLKLPWNYLPNFVIENLPYNLWDAMLKPRERDLRPCCPTTFKHTTNLDGWLENMDFGKLRSLELDTISSTSLHKLSPVLTNLESLTLHSGNMCTVEALLSFLGNTTIPLRNLNLEDMPFDSFDGLLDVVTAKHGESLTSLSLYENEKLRSHNCWRWQDEDHPNCQTDWAGTWYDDHLYLNASQLRHLRQSASEIRALDIDLDRNLDVVGQVEILETLGSFNNLSKLTLRLQSPTFQGCSTGECKNMRGRYGPPLYDPLVNETWAQDVFKHIRLSQSVQSGWDAESNSGRSQLTELGIILGPWDSRHQHGMSRQDKFVLGRFNCSARPAQDIADGDIEECSGGLAWPDDYMREYEPEYDVEYNKGHPFDEL